MDNRCYAEDGTRLRHEKTKEKRKIGFNGKIKADRKKKKILEDEQESRLEGLQ